MKLWIRIFTLSTLVWQVNSVSSETFIAEGSDLLSGVGPAEIALSGAATARSTGIYAAYWNPAGIIDTRGFELAFSRQLDGALEELNFFGLANTTTISGLNNLRVGYAIAWLPRLHVRSEGNFAEDDIESVFLRFALPEVPDDFDGWTHSKTRDFRFALAVQPSTSPWMLGISFGIVRCVSNLCGATISAPNIDYSATTDASAFAINIGAKYRFSEELTLGVTVKDVHTTLHVESSVTHGNTERTEKFTTAFPRDINLGAAWQFHPSLIVSIDYQAIRGNYGKYGIDLQLLRGGLSYDLGQYTLRAGAMIPLVLEGSFDKDFMKELPAPFSPTTGLGWSNKYSAIDLAIYPNPLVSYRRNSIKLSADLSLKIFF